jgi:hypothetical protein
VQYLLVRTHDESGKDLKGTASDMSQSMFLVGDRRKKDIEIEHFSCRDSLSLVRTHVGRKQLWGKKLLKLWVSRCALVGTLDKAGPSQCAPSLTIPRTSVATGVWGKILPKFSIFAFS